MDEPETEQQTDPVEVDEGPDSAERKPSKMAQPVAGAKKDEPGVLAAGNPLRWLSLLYLLAAGVPFLLMAADRHWGSWAVPLGAFGVAVAGFGLLDFFGTFDDPPERAAGGTTLALLGPRLIEAAAALIVLVALLKLAVAGTLLTTIEPLLLGAKVQASDQIVLAAVVIPLVFLWLVVAVFRVGRALGAWQLDEDGLDRPLLRRHGFWLIALVTGLYLPLLGSFSLSDPWETHYGEVAREMLSRDDWISLWWAQDGWFWSKPIYDFWTQGLSFSALGVSYQPDQMLAAVAAGRWPQPEWAARLPVFLVTLLGVYLLYRGVARGLGRRAGFLAGVVLTTVPYWYFLSHQTMTDMPYVGPLTAAFGCLALAFSADPERQVRTFVLTVGKRRLGFSLYHLVFGALILIVLPQILYLFSRNVTFQLVAEQTGFNWHWDQFFSGSGLGNCGLPGNQPCRHGLEPRYGAWYSQPGLMGLMWLVLLGVALWLNWGERRQQRLYFLAAWICTALAAMAKGAPGLVLPVAATLAFLVVTLRFKDFGRIEPVGLLLIVGLIVVPWYLQMYLRHGGGFIDRLIFHDMYKRAFVHVHDTNAGDDVSFRYYVWQLGYGLFPWTGLSVGGLLWWGRARRELEPRGAQVLSLMLLWFLVGFGMFSITLTKFHHYIFPVVPPIAVLTAYLIDRALGPGSPFRAGRCVPYLSFMATGALLFTYGMTWLFQGQLDGSVPGGELRPAMPAVGWPLTLLGVGLLIGTPLLLGSRRSDEEIDFGASSEERSYGAMVFGATGIAAAVVLGLVGRDLFTTHSGDVTGPARLMQLFTYNYRRTWPEALDFHGVLGAFTLVGVLLLGLFAVRRYRAHAAVAFTAFSIWVSAWGVNAYLVRCSPHWGQRETMLAYYTHRKSAAEPIIAYQMNWKGENFYTGNRVPAFVSSGKKFKDWIQTQKEKGVKVMFISTEHGRVGNLKRELGDPKDFQVLTDKALNNKFTLTRVEFEKVGEAAKKAAAKKKAAKKAAEAKAKKPTVQEVTPGASAAPSVSAAPVPPLPVPPR